LFACCSFRVYGEIAGWGAAVENAANWLEAAIDDLGLSDTNRFSFTYSRLTRRTVLMLMAKVVQKL
jgi:hypothetical protein